MNRTFPLHVHISTLFIVLMTLLGSLIGGLGYHFSHRVLEATAEDLSRRINRETLGALEGLFAPAQMAVGLLAREPQSGAASLDARLAGADFMRTALLHSTALSSLYVGYPNGDFLFMRRILNAEERRSLDAPEDTAFVIQGIQHGAAPRGEYRYLDADLRTLRVVEKPDYAAQYDPRQRGWYRDALAHGGAIQTAPYVFFSNRKVGTTLAAPSRLIDGAVIGADIELTTLSASLTAQKLTPGSELALLDDRGLVVAYSGDAHLGGTSTADGGKPGLIPVRDFHVPVLAAAADVLPLADGDMVLDRRQLVGDEAWRVGVQKLVSNGAVLYLVTAVPERELLASAFLIRDTSAWITALVVLLSIPLTWGIARALSGPLRTLVREVETIRHFDFSDAVAIPTLVKEVHELTVTIDDMKRTIRRFLDINTALIAESDFDRLLPLLLSETLSAASADAGILYLCDDTRLTPSVALGTDGKPIDAELPPVALDGPDCQARRALGGDVSSAFAPDEGDRELLGLTRMQAPSPWAIAVPLRNRDGQLIGAMLLLRRGDIEKALLDFIDALSGAAAVALENQVLIKQQRALFDSFVKVIAGAIDAKNPYTGGHCSRVPELAKMLARAACNASDGPYRDFSLDARGWERVHLAAWLHDCGKVTTPEYVIDKATKLETLNDRIHEVRMRFEVLKRDAEIRALRAIIDGDAQTDVHADLQRELTALDADFAFVAECNVGGEDMPPGMEERLRTIASRTWTRTLDDRIGISDDELARKARLPAQPLPASEQLLADKPEHLFERRPSERFDDDNPWGFHMDVPHWLYNRGELHNLSVARGTLTNEERYKINEHIVQTEIMLRQLVYPRHLRDVPEIAASHHEKMDGTGYPKRLTGEQMSPLARMMAIADIFEALTAIDRPYKKGKTLSESLAIMTRMVANHHIDPELFALFLRGGVYREYAERFMRREQIDNVDIDALLAAI
ncbi:HD domain-containing protein [Azoarcus sp. L1K30]|uniref:HD domain-containing phosphohydrolase n=1 Tax=Azoarcus sp. L1K30 TaxID=2820277 RepID=UPI001B838EF3|nr:HD domain-containing phosphohydrolase [Azoarcus sp. L1K30]MBR0566864.1 HD domain-containing protein [Azoarcus sp. L1K30]